MLLGAPIGVALAAGGAIAIAVANAGVQWFGLLAVPQNFYAGMAKYPLLAIPMFVLVGVIFDRSGVAQRLVDFAVAHRRRAARACCRWSRSWSAMFLGGISGSGPANAAAVGSVMIGAMSRAGYPPAFSASVVGAAAATDILIPPSIAFIVYSVLVPGASVPALFAAGMIPGILCGLALIIPAVWLSRQQRLRRRGSQPAARRRFWRSLREVDVGHRRAVPHPRRHARRLVHADRGRGGGRVLRPVRRLLRAPHDDAQGPVPAAARLARRPRPSS